MLAVRGSFPTDAMDQTRGQTTEAQVQGWNEHALVRLNMHCAHYEHGRLSKPCTENKTYISRLKIDLRVPYGFWGLVGADESAVLLPAKRRSPVAHEAMGSEYTGPHNRAILEGTPHQSNRRVLGQWLQL